MTGRALVVQADALRLPLPDESVDLICTSPPFYALRRYDGPEHQLGSEPTPQAYLEALWQATSEMARVLKPTGSIFVDLGDKYATAFGPNSATGKTNWSNPNTRYDGSQRSTIRSTNSFGIREKSLMLLPERYRIGCVDHLGLIARAVIVWNKANGLPESVTDRVRRSHEDWVHLTRSPRYYAAVDEVREPHEHKRDPATYRLTGAKGADPARHKGLDVDGVRSFTTVTSSDGREYNPLGKLPGSVWSIPSEPLRLPDHLGVDHYAAFPSEWPRRLILGFSPPGVCVACGHGRWPVVERTEEQSSHVGDELLEGVGEDYGARPREQGRQIRTSTGWHYPSTRGAILGYACACTPHTNHPGTGGGVEARLADGQVATVPGNAPIQANSGGLWNQPKVGPWREYHLAGWQAPPTRPAVVVDVFGGTGTVAGVARQLGRIGISIDLSHSYSRAARYRIFQSGDFGKAEGRTWRDRQRSLL